MADANQLTPIEELRGDLEAYEARTRENYYGLLVRLQASLMRVVPDLLARLDAAEAVCDAVDRHHRAMEECGYTMTPPWPALDLSLDAWRKAVGG